MIDPVRQEVLATAQTVVVKVGTNVLTHADGTLDRPRVAGLVDQVHALKSTGRRVALVSSGAIGAGVGLLKLGTRPTDLRHLQAAAAVGQSALMAAYEEGFKAHGYHAAQVLLTASDFDHRVRYLNVRNTLNTLFEWGCVPVINENDTISVAEIKFGDNDHLAAMVTNLLRAPLLVLLTNVDGLYEGDPAVVPQAKVLTTVPCIDRRVAELAGDTKSQLGTGGMRSKLRAARLVTMAGECVIMANGSVPGILGRIAAAEPVGTLFLPHGGMIAARKRWIGMTAQPRGKLRVDAGARRALEVGGKSLLAIGINAVFGQFQKGDVVAIVDRDGEEFARGLSNCSAVDVRRMQGLHSDEIAQQFGSGHHYAEVVHRDNLVITSEPESA
jgi:glutamate 5-kinase